MDANMTNIGTMSETELRELLRSGQEALDRLVAKRARSTLKEAKRMAAEVGYELTFVKTGKSEGRKSKEKPLSSRAKVLPKYRNPDNSDETWSGRGRQPKWVQAALAGGEGLADLAIPAAADEAED
jgi:DNA-binding protein H-NS